MYYILDIHSYTAAYRYAHRLPHFTDVCTLQPQMAVRADSGEFYWFTVTCSVITLV